MSSTIRSFLIAFSGLIAAMALLLTGIVLIEERVLVPSTSAGEMPVFETNQRLITPNTVRIGTDDPVETAVAVSQAVYPATEAENTPGAVILVNQNNLAEVIVAASRVQHFPVNAPLLYVDDNGIPELTRNELQRLKPEGVPVDGNVQVYLVGTISDAVEAEVQDIGYSTRAFSAENPIELAEVVDNWTSTLHGDHNNVVVIANLDNLEPAIPSAFWNAHEGDGLAFVTDDGVPQTTIDMLERRANGPWIYLFGDETVISESIARELAQYGHVSRMPRSEIQAMSAFFAGYNDSGQDWGAWWWEMARDFGWGNSDAGRNAIFVNVEGPGGWQNAIVATTLSHMGKHAPVLAVNQDGIPEDVVNYLRILKPYPTAPQEQLVNHGWVIGGEQTINWETQTEIDLLLDAYIDQQANREQ